LDQSRCRLLNRIRRYTITVVTMVSNMTAISSGIVSGSLSRFLVERHSMVTRGIMTPAG
jgi:hypothetical protein